MCMCVHARTVGRESPFVSICNTFSPALSPAPIPPTRTSRAQVRTYLHRTRQHAADKRHEETLSALSPMLHGEVALSNHTHALSSVWYFHNCERAFVQQVALALHSFVYAPTELVPGDNLHIVLKGVAVRGTTVYTLGSCWGEDMLLDSVGLRNITPATALTYLEVNMLSRRQLEDIMAVRFVEEGRQGCECC